MPVDRGKRGSDNAGRVKTLKILGTVIQHAGHTVFFFDAHTLECVGQTKHPVTHLGIGIPLVAVNNGFPVT